MVQVDTFIAFIVIGIVWGASDAFMEIGSKSAETNNNKQIVPDDEEDQKKFIKISISNCQDTPNDSEISSTVSSQSTKDIEDEEDVKDSSPKTSDCSTKKSESPKLAEIMNEDLPIKKTDLGVLEEVIGYFKNSSFLVPYLVNQCASLFNNFLIASCEL